MSGSAPVVARVVLDRGGRANALDAATVEQLHTRLDDASDADVVVVEARGRAFCGGLDLGGLDDETDASLLLRLVRVQVLLERVQALPGLTVVLLEGPAVGAGADLALACDVRLATPGASLRFPGSGFGAVLGTARLAAQTSPSYAAEVAASGRPIAVDEAAARGLVRLLPDRDALDEEVARLAESAAHLPGGTSGRLRAAAAPGGPDPMGALVRSLVARPGLHDRVRAYAERSPART